MSCAAMVVEAVLEARKGAGQTRNIAGISKSGLMGAAVRCVWHCCGLVGA